MVFAAVFLYQWRTAPMKARGKGANVTEQQMMRALIKILAMGFGRNLHICHTLCKTNLEHQGTARFWGVNRGWYPSHSHRGKRGRCHLSWIRHRNATFSKMQTFLILGGLKYWDYSELPVERLNTNTYSSVINGTVLRTCAIHSFVCAQITLMCRFRMQSACLGPMWPGNCYL